MHIPRRITLISNQEFWGNEDIESIEAGWLKFYQKYPNQVIYGLSRVKFNREKNQAVLEFRVAGGSRACTGVYIFLTKNEETGTWRIIDQEVFWIS